MWRLPVPEFTVLVYGADLPSAGLRASARFEPGVLVIEGKGRWYTVPAKGISLKRGGYDGRQWLIGWHSPAGPMSAQLQGDGTLDAFARAAPPRLSSQLRHARRARARRAWRARGRVAVLAGLLLGPLLLLGLFRGYADELGRWAVQQVDFAQEARLGETAFRQLQPGLKLVREGLAQDAVELVGVRLTAGSSRYRYRFHLVQSTGVSVLALPGGHVLVSGGLVHATQSAEELAGVMAHEISHVEMRHTLSGLIRELGWRAVLGAILQDFSGTVWGDMAAALRRLRFDRDAELEADREGIRLMRRTGLPAQGLERFFERLGAAGQAGSALLTAHPYDADRGFNLSEAVGDPGDYPSGALDMDWRRVKRDLARRAGKAATPTDRSASTEVFRLTPTDQGGMPPPD